MDDVAMSFCTVLACVLASKAPTFVLIAVILPLSETEKDKNDAFVSIAREKIFLFLK